jgi:hypothetical protein
MAESKEGMLFRLSRIWIALGLLVAVWALVSTRHVDSRAWVRPIGTRVGPVRILQFYASVGALTMGEKALLCYGVENAKSVRISPSPAVSEIYPSLSHCVEIVPTHTTHYTILAEGFDGRVAMQSFTLMVQEPGRRSSPVGYAELQ